MARTGGRAPLSLPLLSPAAASPGGGQRKAAPATLGGARFLACNEGRAFHGPEEIPATEARQAALDCSQPTGVTLDGVVSSRK